MVFQNELDGSISHIACYFTSIASYRELYQAHKWTAKELNGAFALCKMKGSVDTSNCIKLPDGVAGVLGCKLKFLGKFYPDNFTNSDDLFVIGCWKMTREAEDAHFVVMVPNCQTFTKDFVLFDPWKNPDGSGSKTVREGICTSLRVFKKC